MQKAEAERERMSRIMIFAEEERRKSEISMKQMLDKAETERKELKERLETLLSKRTEEYDLQEERKMLGQIEK